MKDRVFEIAKAAQAGFFGPRHPGLTVDKGHFRWRFSPDARLALIDELKAEGVPVADAGLAEYLLGIPLDVDETLPPNSVVLEPL
jgi:hypothetical protein